MNPKIIVGIDQGNGTDYTVASAFETHENNVLKQIFTLVEKQAISTETIELRVLIGIGEYYLKKTKGKLRRKCRRQLRKLRKQV